VNDAHSLHDAPASHQTPSLPRHAGSRYSGSRYAGFWRRLLASTIDGLVFTPAAVMGWWALSSRTAALVLLIPSSACWYLYRVVMHAHRGQTIGKVLARIRLVTTSGLQISWREALLRDSVSFAFTALATTSTLSAVTLTAEAAWGQGWRETASMLAGAEPSWGHWVNAASTVWLWSDLLVLLFNGRRRSLHDFIAGTVVIRTPRDMNSSPPGVP
jgi:uncharacterized RDD family membrane protein YckC